MGISGSRRWVDGDDEGGQWLEMVGVVVGGGWTMMLEVVVMIVVGDSGGGC